MWHYIASDLNWWIEDDMDARMYALETYLANVAEFQQLYGP